MLGLGLGLDKPRGLIYFQNQYSMYFDGVDDRIITDGADTVLQNTTYSFWAKSSLSTQNYVFGHGGFTDGGFIFNENNGTMPLLYLSSGRYIKWNTTGYDRDGEWHHWVVFLDKDTITNCKLWVDGVLQTVNTTVSSSPAAAYTESLTIGARQASGGSFFNGNIDEFAVFDRELTQDEITRMYNTYYTNNLIQNSGFDEIGDEEVTNRDFSQIGNEEVDNGSFSEIGNEEVTGFTNGTTYPFTTFTTSGNNITSAIVSSAFAGAVSNAISVTSGKIYKVTFDYTKNSGDDLRVVFSSVVSGAGAQISNSELISASGSYTKYFTITSTTTGYLQMGTGNSGHSLNASITNVSVKEVGQGWTADSNWTIDQANNKAISDGSQSGNVSLRQSNSIMGLTTGSFYKVEFTISNYSEGQINPHVRGNASGNVSGDGVKTSYIAAGSGSDGINLYSNLDFAGDISNISVKEVGQHWTVTGSDSTHYVEFLSTGARFVSDTVSPVLELKQNAITPGKQYVLTCNVAYTGAGQLRVNVGSNLTAFTEGANTRYFTATSNTMSFLRENANVDCVISNVSVKEVGQNWEVANPDADNYIVFNGSTARLKFLNTSPLTQLIAQGFTLTSGKTYKLTVDVASVTSGSIKIDAVGMSELFNTAGVTTRILQPTGNSDLTFYRATADVDITLNSVTLQQLKHSATNLLVNSGDYQSASPLLTSTKSMFFDGGDEYLQLSEPFSHTNHTICAWVYNDSVGTDEIFSASDSVSDGIRLMTRSTGNFRYRLNSVNNDSAVGTFEANKWYFVVGTYDGTTSNLYINGALSNSVTTSQTISITTNSRIGSQSYNVGALYDGNITEVGAFNRALTALEVASLYNQGMPTNLLVNRNNYQSGNPTVFNTKQVDFDGTDDRLVVTNAYGSFTGSVSAWVKRDTVAASWIYIADFRTNSGSGYLAINSLYNIDTGVGGTVYVDNVVTSAVPQDTEWHHVVVTGIALNITESIFFGSRHTSADFFDGDISQIGLWNTTLTADEVSSLYNHGLPIDLTTDQAAYESSSNLVGYWRMGSGTLDTYPLIADQTNATLGSELLSQPVDLQTDFINNSGGVIVDADTFTTAGGTLDGIVTSISLEIGKTYKLTVEGNTTSSGFTFGSANGTGREYGSGFGTHYFTALHVNIWVRQSTAGITNITSFTLKQVQGNPAMMINLGGGADFSDGIKNGSPYANIVQQSDFANGDNWYEGTGCTISGGKAIWTSAPSGSGFTGNNLNAAICTVGKTYKVTFTIDSISEGALKIRKPFNSSVEYTSAGTYTETAVAAETDIYIQNQGTTTATIDNVTVEEVNTGLQGYWKMGDGTNDEYPVIYDQTNPTLGSEEIVNGDFSSSDISMISGAGTKSVVNNELKIEESGAGFSQVIYNGILDTLKIYKATFNLTIGTGSYNIYSTTQGNPQITSSGTYTFYLQNTNRFYAGSNGAGDVWYMDNISVKEVQGNSAIMTAMPEGNITNQYPLTKIRNYYRMGDGTLDSKFTSYPATAAPFIFQDQTSPNLAHIPTTNLVTYSEDFTQSDWTKTNVDVSNNTELAPNNTLTATRTIINATGTDLRTQCDVIASSNYTWSFYAKKGTSTDITYRVYDVSNGSNIVSPTNYYSQLSTNWERVTLNFTTPSGCTSVFVYLTSDSVEIGDIYLWGAQLEEQTQAETYAPTKGIPVTIDLFTENNYGHTQGGEIIKDVPRNS